MNTKSPLMECLSTSPSPFVEIVLSQQSSKSKTRPCSPEESIDSPFITTSKTFSSQIPQSFEIFDTQNAKTKPVLGRSLSSPSDAWRMTRSVQSPCPSPVHWSTSSGTARIKRQRSTSKSSMFDLSGSSSFEPIIQSPGKVRLQGTFYDWTIKTKVILTFSRNKTVPHLPNCDNDIFDVKSQLGRFSQHLPPFVHPCLSLYKYPLHPISPSLKAALILEHQKNLITFDSSNNVRPQQQHLDMLWATFFTTLYSIFSLYQNQTVPFFYVRFTDKTYLFGRHPTNNSRFGLVSTTAHKVISPQDKLITLFSQCIENALDHKNTPVFRKTTDSLIQSRFNVEASVDELFGTPPRRSLAVSSTAPNSSSTSRVKFGLKKNVKNNEAETLVKKFDVYDIPTILAPVSFPNASHYYLPVEVVNDKKISISGFWLPHQTRLLFNDPEMKSLLKSVIFRTDENGRNFNSLVLPILNQRFVYQITKQCEDDDSSFCSYCCR